MKTSFKTLTTELLRFTHIDENMYAVEFWLRREGDWVKDYGFVYLTAVNNRGYTFTFFYLMQDFKKFIPHSQVLKVE